MPALTHLEEWKDVSNNNDDVWNLVCLSYVHTSLLLLCECIYTFCLEQSVTELAALLLSLQPREEDGFKARFLVAPHLPIHFKGGAERRRVRVNQGRTIWSLVQIWLSPS